MNKILLTAMALCGMALVSCQHKLESESGLYNVKLNHNTKVLVDGAWTWGKGNPYAHHQTGKIYIHPMNISKVSKEHPKTAQIMVVQMQDYMTQAFAAQLKDLNRKNHVKWSLTTNPAEADVCFNTALVKFKPQKPALKAVSSVGGLIGGVPGASKLLGIIADGDIVIEGTIRDTKSGQLLLAFKDSNRKQVRLYTKEAYSETGNADANLKEWAHNLAELMRMSAYDQLGDSTLKKKVEERSYLDVFSQAAADAL